MIAAVGYVLSMLVCGTLGAAVGSGPHGLFHRLLPALSSARWGVFVAFAIDKRPQCPNCYKRPSRRDRQGMPHLPFRPDVGPGTKLVLIRILRLDAEAVDRDRRIVGPRAVLAEDGDPQRVSAAAANSLRKTQTPQISSAE